MKILVIKLRALGDVLLSTPVFSELQREYPEAEIDAYVYREAVPMLKGHPAIRKVIACDRKWSELWQIRQRKYDLVIALTEGDRSAIVSLFSGAKVRVGFAPKAWWLKKAYTRFVKSCSTLRHAVERNLDALRVLGITPQKKELFWQVEDYPIDKPYVLIHPGARWKFKRYPKMREVATKLCEEGRFLVYAADDGCEDLPGLHLGGKITLKELGGLIQGAEFVLCVDSVPFHMANALKKPVVAIFGPTSEITWGPWQNPNARIVAQNLSCRPCYMDGCGGSKRADCLESLPVSQVLQSIKSLPKYASLASLLERSSEGVPESSSLPS